MAFGDGFRPYWQIETTLDLMEQYVHSVQAFLEQHARAYGEQLDAEAANVPEEEREAFYDALREGYWDMRDEFPKQLYSSFLATWYAFVEQEWVALCRPLGINYAAGRAQDTGITRVKQLLKQQQGYDFADRHRALWQEVNYIGHIRNKIMHSGLTYAMLEHPPQQHAYAIRRPGSEYYIEIEANLRQYLVHQQLFMTDNRPQIMLTYPYCRHLITFGRTLFETLYHDLSLPTA